MSAGLDQLKAFTQELTQLIDGSLPLEGSLRSAGRLRGNQLESLCERVQAKLEQGDRLDEILAAESSLPDILTIAVFAGARTGRPAMMLEVMGDFVSEVIQFRSRIVRAAMYPMIIMAIISFLLATVVQSHLASFLRLLVTTDLSAEVPSALTELLRLNIAYPAWVLIPPFLLLAVVCWWYLSGRSSALRFGRGAGLFTVLPGFRSLLSNLQSWIFCRLILQLLRHELPLQDALTIASRAAKGSSVSKDLLRLAGQIEAGGDCRSSELTHLPPLLAACLIREERSEQQMLQSLSSAEAFYRDQFEQRVMWNQLLLPPAMFFTVGGGSVLAYALLVFWPIFEVYLMLGKP